MKRVAIVGAGMGGLCAGILLKQKGHQVTLFESHTQPGGYTAGFRRKGFYFESGTLSFESLGMIKKAMKKLGVLERLRFEPHRQRMCAATYDAIVDSYGNFKQMCHEGFPAQQANLNRYFNEVGKMYRAMKPLMTRSNPLAKLVAALRMGAIYMKYKNTTLGEFTARYFEKGTEIYRTFAMMGYPNMGAFLLGGALATILDDYWVVKDGMQQWADALADEFRRLGGELKLQTRVDQIITRGGRAVGVRFGETVHEADAVIAAGDYKKTMLKLLDDQRLIPGEHLEKVRNATVSEGVFVVYLGLTIPHDRLKEVMRVPSVMCMDHKAGFEKHDPADSDYFKKTPFGIYAPSLHNPELAPQGKSSLMLQATCPYHWMDNWGGDDRQRYQDLKTQVQETLIRRAAAVIPDLEQHIELKDSATPRTFERYTHNTDGATSAWSWNPNNRFYKSPMRVYVDTPVPNLYIGSCWAAQIGGVPNAISAAMKCARRI